MTYIRSRISTGALLALGVAAFLALLAFAPGAWGTAYGQTTGPNAPPPPVTETVPADTGGTVTAGDVQVVIPAGAISEDVEVTVSATEVVTDAELDALGLPDPPVAPAGATVITAIFSLEALAADGTVFDVNNPFDAPVTINLDIPAETLAEAGGNLDSIFLGFFNTSTGAWQLVPCTVSGGQLSCQVSHFSLWGVFVVPADGGGTTAPGQGAPVPPATGTGLGESPAGDSLPWFAVAGAVIAASVIGGLAVRQTVRRS